MAGRRGVHLRRSQINVMSHNSKSCKVGNGISRLLSLVLRHEPDRIGVRLDVNGWALVDELLAGLKRAGYNIDQAQLQEIVESNQKKRFTISSDRKKIRAAQGHSLPVDLGIEPSKP